MAEQLTIASEQLSVVIDVRRGADFRSIVDARTGIDLLFRTPWAQRAKVTSQLAHVTSTDAWLEGFQGGWNTLCPNAGPPRIRAGIEQGFHGEVALLPWTVEASDATSVELSVEMVTAPLRLVRHARVDAAVLTVQDTITNLSPNPVDFDYQHHPAFGAPLLAPGCMVETDARSYVVSPRNVLPGEALVPGQRYAWPPEGFDRLPGQGEPLARLGWLTDFTAGWAALRNPAVDLAAVLSWDANVLPNAWFWQELNHTAEFPWFGRAYAMALEPSSTVNAGPGREQSMSLPGNGSRNVTVRLSVSTGDRPVAGVTADGSVLHRDDAVADSA